MSRRYSESVREKSWFADVSWLLGETPSRHQLRVRGSALSDLVATLLGGAVRGPLKVSSLKACRYGPALASSGNEVKIPAMTALAVIPCGPRPGRYPMRRSRGWWFACFAAVAFDVSFATAALAQSYPDRPVHLIVAFPPGGGANFVARLLAELLSIQLGQAVVAENRPGSNGNVAGDLVAHAAADGYTILQSSGSLLSVNPHLYATMPIDPFNDLLPVATITSDELLLTENPALEPKHFRDFIDYAGRAKPPLLYGSIGNGSEHHLAMELLKEQAGIQMTHVPYRGGGPAAIGVMGGEVAAMFGGGSVTPLVQAGKLRALAISGRKRSPIFPDLPSISEIYPAYDVTIWQALFLPAATPQEVVKRLRAAVNAAIAQPDFAKKLTAAGSGEPFATTPNEMAALIRADDERFGRVIRASGLKVE